MESKKEPYSSKKEPYNVVVQGGMGEIEEKKSRFIANVALVNTEEEALEFIEKMRKKYWDARHNCYAYVIGENAQLMRFSDDGEPSGTAGKPILEVLQGANVRNVVVVVTRYFGGTLLGTGGLVRAYTQATQAGIDASDIRTMIYGTLFEITTDYNGIGKIQYIMGLRKLMIEEAEYAAAVSFKVKIPYEEEEGVRKEITEATAGKAKIEKLKDLYYLV